MCDGGRRARTNDRRAEMPGEPAWNRASGPAASAVEASARCLEWEVRVRFNSRSGSSFGTVNVSVTTMSRVLTALVIVCAISVPGARAFALDTSLDLNQYAHTAWTVGSGFVKGPIRAMAQKIGRASCREGGESAVVDEQ